MLRYSLTVLLMLLVVSLAGVGYTQDNSALPGQIAYIGTDRNVYLATVPDTPLQLTTDGTLAQRYTWPTWSTDGRLAYFSINTNPTSFRTEAFVYSSTTGLSESVYVGDGEVFNYAAWAPGNCSISDTCRELAILLNNSSGLFVEMVQDGVLDYPHRTIGRGAPFYFSWNGDGSQMLWQRNNNRLDIYTNDTDSVSLRLEQRPGIFQAPHWSPTAPQWLLGKLTDSGTDLVVVTAESETTLAEAIAGIVYFAWSPNGESVAYVGQGGPLLVVDAVQGNVQARTVLNGVLSFFWSPDSSKVAFVSLASPAEGRSARSGILAAPAPQPAFPGLAWSVLDVATGDITVFPAFLPTPDMVYMLTYFDQFAQSHRVWSPDGRYIVYAEITEAGDSQIVTIDTANPSQPPTRFADGTLGVWSFF